MPDGSRGPLRRILEHPWTIVWCLLALGLVLRTADRDRGVLIDHLEFGRRLFAGEDLYATYLDEGRPLHPVYPPSFGLLTWPFSLLGERLARLAWGVFQVLALTAIARVILDWLRTARAGLWPRRHWLLLITFLLGSRYVLRDTHGGGGNLINLALALLAFRDAERGHKLRGGLWLGLSLATKPTTALLVPFFVMVGNWRVALGGVVTAAGALAVAFAVHGFEVAPFERWVRGAWALAGQKDVFEEPAYGLPPFAWMNQSLRCAVGRFAGSTPDEFAAKVPGFVQGLGLDASTVVWITRVVSLSLLAWIGRRVFRLRGSREGRFVALTSVLALSLLLSPISWKAHHTALLPAFALLAAAVLERRRGALVWAIGYYLVCTAGGGDLVGRAGKYWQQAHYLATFGALAILYWLGRDAQMRGLFDRRGLSDPSARPEAPPGAAPSDRTRPNGS